jgi:ribonuclease J
LQDKSRGTKGRMPCSLTVFDGLDCIGGTKILLQTGETRVFLDFGINFRKFSQYFSNFLRPRSSRGIHDFLELGLVPPLPVYRNDLVPSDLSLSSDMPANAIYLSHAHTDHSGCAGLLNRETLLCCSPLTAAILRGMQDVGRESPAEEVVYARIRRPRQEEGRVLLSDRVSPLEGREVRVTGSIGGLDEAWRQSPFESRGLNLETCKIVEAQGPLTQKAWEVDHSIPGSTALALETEAGWVVYTGDFRMHGEKSRLTERFVEEAAGLEPRLLIIEGTRVTKEQDRRETEEEVYMNCLRAVRGERGLVVADFSPRNFERLEVFRRIAGEVGRELVILPEDAYMLRLLECVDGRDRLSGLGVYGELKEVRDTWEKRIRGEVLERMVDPSQVSQNPSRYLLCMSLWDINHLLDVNPRGGAYIYSSSEAFSEEELFDFQRLHCWLEHFRMRVVGLKFKDGKVEFEPGYHASGHASPKELLEVIERIRPREVLPLHTEDRKWFRKKVKRTEVLLPAEGEQVLLE